MLDFLTDWFDSLDASDLMPAFDGDLGEALTQWFDSLGIDLSQYTPNEIREALSEAFSSDAVSPEAVHSASDISFGASYDVESRNDAMSKLVDKLNYHDIKCDNLHPDKSWGGLDYDSANDTYNALNQARAKGSITDSEYKDLVALLKKASHT